MKKNSGFSLIELLIVLAIITILGSIVYPTYEHFSTEVRRTDGKAALMDLAARMERYYVASGHTYEGASLENLGVGPLSPEGYYQLSVTHLSDTTYMLQAKPLGSQALKDTVCGALTLDQLGQKGITGKGNVSQCW